MRFGPNKHRQGTVVKVDKTTANKKVSSTNLGGKNTVNSQSIRGDTHTAQPSLQHAPSNTGFTGRLETLDKDSTTLQAKLPGSHHRFQNVKNLKIYTKVSCKKKKKRHLNFR